MGRTPLYLGCSTAAVTSRYTDSMKLFVLSLCCVVVLATASADLDRKEELEKVLDKLSNALSAEEAKTEDILGEGIAITCVQ